MLIAMVDSFLLRRRFWIMGTVLTLGSMLLCLGGGYWLLYTTWVSGQRKNAALRSSLIGESLLARIAPSHNKFNGYALWAAQTLPLILEHQKSYHSVSYILIWKSDGTVVFLARKKHHTFILDSRFMDHTLDPTHWPSPNGNSMAIRVIRRLPWSNGTLRYVDTTLPLIWPRVTAYLSIGYPVALFTSQFFHDERRPLLILVAIDLLGGVFMAMLVFFIKRGFDKSRSQYARTLLARTSLLSERGMLASVLAHEVRSPLTALRFNLHFMRGLLDSPNNDPSRHAELLHSCEREVRRLDLMLDDFLSRTQIVGPARDASLNTVVTEALDFLRPALASQDIRVITHLDSANPHVPISSDELRQVLLNLCTNAQEAMHRSGTLVISTMAEPESAVLLVRDNGNGIPPEVQERMFDPFFTTKPHGSGLGLALVRRVVTGAGGGVFFESEVKRGTTFRIVLPRTSLSSALSAVTVPEKDKNPGASPAVKDQTTRPVGHQ